MLLNLLSFTELGISSWIIYQQYGSLNIKSENSPVIVGIACSVLIFDSSFLFIFLIKLFLLHLWLVSKNLTFYEYIREKWKGYPGNHPFFK
jgi:hypothetical protein